MNESVLTSQDPLDTNAKAGVVKCGEQEDSQANERLRNGVSRGLVLEDYLYYGAKSIELTTRL